MINKLSDIISTLLLRKRQLIHLTCIECLQYARHVSWVQGTGKQSEIYAFVQLQTVA